MTASAYLDVRVPDAGDHALLNVQQRRTIYEVSRALIFILWIPAYVVLLMAFLREGFCEYSFLMCTIFTAWEVHFGILALRLTNGTLYTKLFNVAFMTLDFGIAGCMIVYGNSATATWTVPARGALYLSLLAITLLLLHRHAHPTRPNYDIKRHTLIWLMVAAIPLCALLETFTLDPAFVVWSAAGTVLGVGMGFKDFGKPRLNVLNHLSIAAGVAGNLWAAANFHAV